MSGSLPASFSNAIFRNFVLCLRPILLFNMCIRICELYSACRCLYYEHPVDRCAAYGRAGHHFSTKACLVGYACPAHAYSAGNSSSHFNPPSSSSPLYSPPASPPPNVSLQPSVSPHSSPILGLGYGELLRYIDHITEGGVVGKTQLACLQVSVARTGRVPSAQTSSRP